MQLLIAIFFHVCPNISEIAELHNEMVWIHNTLVSFSLLSLCIIYCTLTLSPAIYFLFLCSFFERDKFPALFTVALHLLRASTSAGVLGKLQRGASPPRNFVVVASIEAGFSRFLKRVACPGLLSRRRLLLVKIALSQLGFLGISADAHPAASCRSSRLMLILLVERNERKREKEKEHHALSQWLQVRPSHRRHIT